MNDDERLGSTRPKALAPSCRYQKSGGAYLAAAILPLALSARRSSR